MALKPCKECGKEISTEASVCPNCGKRNPTAKDANQLTVVIVVLVVIVMIGAIASSNSSSPPNGGAALARTNAQLLKSRGHADSLLAGMSASKIKAAPDSTLALIVNAADGTKAPERYRTAKVELARRTKEESAQKRLALVLAQVRTQTADGRHCTKGTRARVSYLFAKYGQWDQDDIVTVACGWIREGLNSQQMRESWGEPDHINRSQGSFGVHEQWVYGESGYAYVYLEDGIVSSWQTSR